MASTLAVPHETTLPGKTKAAVILSLVSTMFLLSCGTGSSVKAANSSFPQVPGLAQRQVQFQGVVYPFYVFVPSSYSSAHALPAILLIHGGGGNGPGVIAPWQKFAEQNGIILAAPTLPLGGNFETAVAPQMYPMIMDATRNEWSIDASRIYLFGVSAGGYTVFDVSMFDSQYFAGGGVFAAVITPDYNWIVQKATRKIPIAIYIGDHDQFFTVAQAQATSNLLTTNGFTVRLKIFPNLAHNYGAVADIVNADLWSFFGQTPPQ
jgi:poly(3-hydroxybutyrate) depolymerase